MEPEKYGFKSDKDYGYQVSLKDGRPFPPGHKLGFSADDTEVDVLRKILDAFIDTSSADSISKFTDYKLEFGLSMLDPMCIALMEKLDEISKELKEIEAQEADIQHLMTKPYLAGTTITAAEKVKIYDMHEEILIKRRNVKDTMTMVQVILDNMIKSRNFILGMNRRMYSAKSDNFRDNPLFQMKSKEEGAAGSTV